MLRFIINRIRARGWRQLRESTEDLRVSAMLRKLPDIGGFKYGKFMWWTVLFAKAEGYRNYYQCHGRFPVRQAAERYAREMRKVS